MRKHRNGFPRDLLSRGPNETCTEGILEPLSGSLRAVVLDPHPLWLDAVRRILDRIGFSVIRCFTSPSEALRAVDRERPDLLVVDVEAHDPGGMDALTCLVRTRDRHPGIRIVVFANSREQEHVDKAFAAGASAYVVKTSAAEDFATAVRQAFDRSLHFAHALRLSEAEQTSSPPSGLTPRELEILSLVAGGRTNAQIGELLHVTPQTVKFHLANIFRKLQVANRTEASRWAQLNGVLGRQPFARRDDDS
jgi:DNA-binding NarL/FixJ family response regulator